MLGNMLNDLAEAIRRWTEKKTQEQLAALQDWYEASGQHLDPIDATVQGQKSPVPG